jgi:hypothetical protein
VSAILQAGNHRDADDLGFIVRRGESEITTSLLPRKPVGRLSIDADEQITTIVATPYAQRKPGTGEAYGDAVRPGQAACLAGVSAQL